VKLATYYYQVLIYSITVQHPFLSQETDVGTQSLTDHEKQEQLHNTTGSKIVKLYFCYYEYLLH